MNEIYKKMYLRLFNRVTDAIELIKEGKGAQAEELLIAAQQETEEIYISAEE